MQWLNHGTDLFWIRTNVIHPLNYAPAVRSVFPHTLRSLCLSCLAGWTVLLAAIAAWIFLDPHEPPELGYTGAFFVFSIVYSLVYAANFLLINIVGHLLLRSRLSHVSLWLRAVGVSVMYALTVPCWYLLVGNKPDRDDWIVFLAIAPTVGFVSFAVLAWSDRPRDACEAQPL